MSEDNKDSLPTPLFADEMHARGAGVRYVQPLNLWIDENLLPVDDKKELAEEVAKLMVDHEMPDVESLDAQTKEMECWPKLSLELMRRGIMDKKVTARNIAEIAKDNSSESKIEKLAAQTDEEWKANDVARDFGHNFIKFSCGDDVLEAALANESIEKLEAMAAEAYCNLLSAKRKHLVLEKAVHKAHELLEHRALEFMEKTS